MRLTYRESGHVQCKTETIMSHDHPSWSRSYQSQRFSVSYHPLKMILYTMNCSDTLSQHDPQHHLDTNHFATNPDDVHPATEPNRKAPRDDSSAAQTTRQWPMAFSLHGRYDQGWGSSPRIHPGSSGCVGWTSCWPDIPGVLGVLHEGNRERQKTHESLMKPDGFLQVIPCTLTGTPNLVTPVTPVSIWPKFHVFFRVLIGD